MAEIGIREFKEKASEILRNVREDHETYLITYQGKPCAILSPFASARSSKTKPKDKSQGLISLRGILEGGPKVSWEEFMEIKKVWSKQVDELYEDELFRTRDEG